MPVILRIHPKKYQARCQSEILGCQKSPNWCFLPNLGTLVVRCFVNYFKSWEQLKQFRDQGGHHGQIFSPKMIAYLVHVLLCSQQIN